MTNTTDTVATSLARNTILCGDALAMLKTLPDNTVNCIVTSPPYFGLRDYNCAGQIGLEPTPQAFVATWKANKSPAVCETVGPVTKKVSKPMESLASTTSDVKEPPQSGMDKQVVKRTYYPYVDEHGKLIYQIVRTDYANAPKDFKQRRPAGRDTWIWNIQGITPVPYRLPDVLKVIADQGMIFLVEGEKCADYLNAALREKGINGVATCNNGGAKHWGEDQSQWLTGANVYMLADNDEVGQEHVEIAGRSLTNVALLKNVRLPFMRPKWDVVDWIGVGHCLEELLLWCRNEHPYIPPPAPDAPAPRPRPAPSPNTGTGNEKRLIAWAHAALEGVTDDYAKLTEGRFDGLCSAATRLGTIAAHAGWLTESECLNALEYAMDRNGYTAKVGHRLASYRAQFYFKRGLEHPCDEPPEREMEAFKPQPRKVTEPAPAPKVSVDWEHGLSIECRALLNTYAPPMTGPVLELWVEGMNAGLIHRGDPVSVRCLEYVSEKLQRGVSRQTIKRVLDQDAVQFRRFWFLYDQQIIEKNPVTDSHDQLERKGCGETVSDPCNPVGRKATLYQLRSQEAIQEWLLDSALTPLFEKYFPARGKLVAPVRSEFLADLGRLDAEELAEELDDLHGQAIAAQDGYQQALRKVHRAYRQMERGLTHPTFVPIPAGRSYGKAGQYVTECVKAVMAQTHGVTQLSKPHLTDKFGLDERQLLTVFRRAKMWVVKNQYRDGDPVTYDDLDTLRHDLRQWDKRYQGYPLMVVSSTGNLFSLKRAGVMAWASAELRTGATLRVRYSQPNLQVLPCFELRKLWVLALVNALCQGVEPEVVQQVEMFPEPEAEPELKPVVVKPVKVKPEPKPEPLTYAEQWLQKVVEVGTGAKINFQAVAEVMDKPSFVQWSLDTLLDRPLDEEPEPVPLQPVVDPCPELPSPLPPPDPTETLYRAWLNLLAQLRAYLTSLMPIPQPVLLLPASCGP